MGTTRTADVRFPHRISDVLFRRRQVDQEHVDPTEQIHVGPPTTGLHRATPPPEQAPAYSSTRAPCLFCLARWTKQWSEAFHSHSRSIHANSRPAGRIASIQRDTGRELCAPGR